MQTVTHYSHHRAVKTDVLEVRHVDDILKGIESAKAQGKRIAISGSRGSFSDIFLSAGQIHFDMRRLNRTIELDTERQQVKVDGGVRICELLSVIMPAGFYLTGLSGSFKDTIAGMVSSNSHGKDSWKHGNFGENINRLQLITANGTVEVLRRDELMKAVVGGLGALGIITTVTFDLKKLKSNDVLVTGRMLDVEEFAAHTALNDELRFGLACMGCKRNNKIVLNTAVYDSQIGSQNDFAVNDSQWRQNFNKAVWKSFRLFWFPSSYKTVNSIIISMQPKSGGLTKAKLLDIVYIWRKLGYGSHMFSNNSFYEMQTLLPYSQFGRVYAELQQLLRSYNTYPIITAIKWHKDDDFYLSFNGRGIAISNTFDTRQVTGKQGALFRQKYVDIVLGGGGKFYLSKYPYFNKAQLQQQYPMYNKWLALKNAYDPGGIFSSERMLQMMAD